MSKETNGTKAVTNVEEAKNPYQLCSPLTARQTRSSSEGPASGSHQPNPWRRPETAIPRSDESRPSATWRRQRRGDGVWGERARCSGGWALEPEEGGEAWSRNRVVGQSVEPEHGGRISIGGQHDGTVNEQLCGVGWVRCALSWRYRVTLIYHGHD
jgi:hypothetical protein